MADLTLCSGDGCPIKDSCYRFTTTPDPDRQSYFSNPPGVTEEGKFSCELFWGQNHQNFYKHIESIIKGETMDKS